MDFREYQKMLDPAYLKTVSMNEIYETVFESRPPLVDGLLYSGTYLFVGAPKLGKSFFMAQLAYHISTGIKFTTNASELTSAALFRQLTGTVGKRLRSGVKRGQNF